MKLFLSHFAMFSRSINCNSIIASRNIFRSCRFLSSNDTVPSNNLIQSKEPIQGQVNEVNLSNLTPEDEKKLKVLKLEYDVFYSTGIRVPDVISDNEWMHLLTTCESVHMRKSYYSHLFKIEKSHANKKEKAQINLKIQEDKRVEIMNKIEAGELENFKNRYLLLLLAATTNNHQYNNLYWSMLNGGQRVVFDFSFEDRMKFVELKDLCKQILACHGYNKSSKDPFHFHFCNLSEESETYKKMMQSMDLKVAPITLSSDSYLNHYPKEKLVYLTPNASDYLEFNHDDVYIIGSLVDKSNEVPVTIAKAKREGIRTAKLPLDKYVKWTMGTKALSLNHVAQILEKVKTTNNWFTALNESLPNRKFMPVTEEILEKDRKKKSYNNDYNSNRQNDFKSNRQNNFNSNRQNDFNSNRQNDFNSNRQNDFNSNRQNDFNSNRQNDFNSNRQNDFNSNRQNNFKSNRQNDFKSNGPNDFKSNKSNK